MNTTTVLRARSSTSTPNFLFEETDHLREAWRLGVTFTRVRSGIPPRLQAGAYGDGLWSRAPDLCCLLRKVQPLRRFLRHKRAWVTGIRRDQSPSRAGADVVEGDAGNGLVKVNPLVHWTRGDVRARVLEHDLPTTRSRTGATPASGAPTAPGPSATARTSGPAGGPGSPKPSAGSTLPGRISTFLRHPADDLPRAHLRRTLTRRRPSQGSPRRPAAYASLP